jgi:hypothetical protein
VFYAQTNFPETHRAAELRERWLRQSTPVAIVAET